jgi:FkbM family methyltransferase
MKKIIKNLIRKTGREIRPINYHEERILKVKNDWLINENINTIIDIGANDGGYATKIRKIFPTAKIYSIEALTPAYNILVSKFTNDKNFYSFNYALSNYTGETSFWECNASSACSSLLEMDELHKNLYPSTANNKLITLPCYKLDDLLQSNILQKNILLKIDVQGSEKIVLEGSKEILKSTHIIYSEVSFNSLYKNSLLFNEYASFLYSLGFKIEGIENISQSKIDGAFLQADAFFKRYKSIIIVRLKSS